MSTDFLTLSEEERRAVFTTGAGKLGRAERLLEKDLWVCWTLEKLFGAEGLPQLVFKGGTSLSKIYDAIHRFSEDVDVTIDRAYFGFEEPYSSKTKREEALKRIIAALPGFAQEHVAPIFSTYAELGVTVRVEGANVRVHYPSLFPAAGEYVADAVLIELGARNPIEPYEPHTLTVDVAELYPKLVFPKPKVIALSPVRTFWEKATILHKDISKGTIISKRLARHYYDLVMLARHKIGKRAMDDPGMLKTVANDKSLLFRDPAAQYGLARPPTLKLVPCNQEQLDSLQADYEKMIDSQLFYETPPPFKELLNELRSLEDRIHQLTV